jgi:nucleoside-diphosphate-sugar epimerase
MRRDQLFDQPEFIPPFRQFEQFAGLRVGMTGHRGVLGHILAGRLREHGVRVEDYPGDITDHQSLSAWFSGAAFDLFFHLAAVVPVVNVEADPVRAFDVNALGAYEVCRQLVRKHERCWLFVASTSHVYQPVPVGKWRPLRVGDKEEPSSVYGRTKLAAEHLCRQLLEAHRYHHCIGRIFSVAHRTQRESYLVPGLIRRIGGLGRGERLKLVDPDALRDILDAETVVDVILHLALRRAQGTINIGSGKPTTVADIARHIAAGLGKGLDIEADTIGAANALVADIEPLRTIINTA